MSDRERPINRYSERNEWRDQVVTNAVVAPPPERAVLAAVRRYPSMSSLEQMVVITLAPTLEALQRLSHGDVEIAIQRPLRGRPWRPQELIRECRQDLTWLAGSDHDLLWIGDARYPESLHRLFDPPAMLYMWGDLAALPETEPAIAMVGTRHPDDNGRRGAFSLGAEAARYGFSVVSGLALGIDAAAHRGTVAAGRGERAVAVLGSGIDTVYPRRNRDFAGAILDSGGILVSEYPPGTLPKRHQFPARNRIIAGLADALVLFQAPEDSGALITVEHGLDIGLTIVVHVSGAGWTGVRSLTSHEVRYIESIDHVVQILQDDAIIPRTWRSPEEPFRGDDGRYDSERLVQFGTIESPQSIEEWRKHLQSAGGSA